MGVTEDALDPGLFNLCLADVEGKRFERYADKSNLSAGTDKIEELHHGRRIARAFENDIGAPIVALTFDNAQKILVPDIDRNYGTKRTRHCEFRLVDVAHDDSRAAGG